MLGLDDLSQNIIHELQLLTQRLGFREFWTIVRVDVDQAAARRESPTTNHFFHLDRIMDQASATHREFSDLLAGVIGIKTRCTAPGRVRRVPKREAPA